jgi:hypothetical protein
MKNTGISEKDILSQWGRIGMLNAQAHSTRLYPTSKYRWSSTLEPIRGSTGIEYIECRELYVPSTWLPMVTSIILGVLYLISYVQRECKSHLCLLEKKKSKEQPRRK